MIDPSIGYHLKTLQPCFVFWDHDTFPKPPWNTQNSKGQNNASSLDQRIDQHSEMLLVQDHIQLKKHSQSSLKILRHISCSSVSSNMIHLCTYHTWWKLLEEPLFWELVVVGGPLLLLDLAFPQHGQEPYSQVMLQGKYS